MQQRHAAIFGLGGIGMSLVKTWQSRAPHADIVAVCGRPNQLEAARPYIAQSVIATTSIADMLKAAPDLVVEVAGHAGAIDVAERVLEEGIDLYLLSVGILADNSLRHRLIDVAKASGASIVIPAGALAGFDGLAAIARIPGTAVTYTSIKPCSAWRGTPAEDTVDLDNLSDETVIFRGSALEAARLYPKNANLAAAVALAGIGFDATRVKLIADPQIRSNRGIIEAVNPASSLVLEVSGPAILENPKTSAIVPESVFSAIDRQAAGIVFA